MEIIKDKNKIAELENSIVRLGRMKNKELYEALATLEIGQAILIKKSEWKAKSHPCVGINSFTYQNKRKGYGKSPMAKKFVGKRFTANLLNTNEYFIKRIK